MLSWNYCKQMYFSLKGNKEVEYSVKVSYIEIYKEELQDLLDIETPAGNLHVREDDKGNTGEGGGGGGTGTSVT